MLRIHQADASELASLGSNRRLVKPLAKPRRRNINDSALEPLARSFVVDDDDDNGGPWRVSRSCKIAYGAPPLKEARAHEPGHSSEWVRF